MVLISSSLSGEEYSFKYKRVPLDDANGFFCFCSRAQVIEAIANAIASTDGCNLLDVDPGISTNRTVYTFVGIPECVVEGALNAARAASHLIDMTKHHGKEIC